VESGTTTRGNAFNPDTSVNLLSLFNSGDRGTPSNNGLSLQEVEMQFAADVDPYFRASALFSVGPDGTGGFEIDPEEVFAETRSLPYVNLKAGKFKATLGRHNQLHTHAFPMIDAPLIHTILLGDEGLNDAGLSAALLLPTPWYSEVTLQVFGGRSATLFDSPTSDDIATVAHWKNLWDLSDSATIEAGVSQASGANSRAGRSNVYGGDLTLKYRPVEGGKYTSFQWSAEYLLADRKGFAADSAAGAATLGDLKRLDGIATWIQYQFWERWVFGARYEVAGLGSRADLESQKRESALIGFLPTEFSGLRLQYEHVPGIAGATDEHRVALQLNISIGAHPAHAY